MTRSQLARAAVVGFAMAACAAVRAPAQQSVAPPPVVASARTMSAGELRIRRALEEPATLDFVETPFVQVVEALKKSQQIPIEIDYRALDAVKIPPESPITHSLQGVSLRTALRVLLRDLNMTYVVDDEVLTITTREVAAGRPTTRAYAVAPLLPSDAAGADALATLIRTLVARPGAGASAATIATYGPLLVVRDTEEGQYEVQKVLSHLTQGLIDASQQVNTSNAAGSARR